MTTLTPDVYSYSFIIRDGILERIKQMPMFQNIAKFGTTKMGRVQLEDIPFFGCYLISEKLTPDGDANAGEARFVHALKLGFSVIIQNNNEEAAEASLDTAHWALMNYLTHPDWHRFDVPGFPRIHIESVIEGNRKHVY